MKQYDVVIIGGGAGGLTAAKTARGFGKRVAIVEKMDRLGGECTWTGCVPSKALIKTAEVAWHTKNLSTFGLQASSHSLDTNNVMDHVRAVVREVYSTQTPDIIEKLGIDVLFGEPTFLDAHHLQVGSDKQNKIRGTKFIIATGSSPFVPPIEGIETVDYLTNEILFDLKTLPKSMIILGGGPIGAEMASALNRLGVHITIVEMQERILPREDEELSTKLMGILNKEGVKIVTGMRATHAAKKGDEIAMTCEDVNGKQHDISAQALLVAVGRRPNIDGLGLENAGVQTNKRGIIVDNTMRTSAKNIYACGDVVGPYLFSHIAWHQAVVAARNAIIPFFKKRMDYKHVIWVTFTAPELASCGLTERDAREQYGDTIQVYRNTYADIDRGHTDRALEGEIKIVCDKKGYILGAHMLGERAGDMIHELQLAKARGIRFHELQSIIHAYPTYAELVWHAAKKAYLDHLERNMLIRVLKRFFVRR